MENLYEQKFRLLIQFKKITEQMAEICLDTDMNLFMELIDSRNNLIKNIDIINKEINLLDRSEYLQYESELSQMLNSIVKLNTILVNKVEKEKHKTKNNISSSILNSKVLGYKQKANMYTSSDFNKK